jgi:hypothetical protein
MNGFQNPIERAQAQIDAMTGVNTPPVEVPAGTPPNDPGASNLPADASIQQNVPPQINEDPNGETYKARWETLQGMFRSAQEREQQNLQRIGMLESQLTQLTQQLAVKQEPVQTPAAPAAKVQEVMSKLSDEVGADLAGQMRELVQVLLEGQMTTVQETVKTVQKSVEDVAAENLRSRQEGFEKALTAQVANWRNIMADPNFAGWLQTNSEPFSGMSYLDCFNKANDGWNLNGLVTIFKQYGQANGLVETPQTTDVNTAPATPTPSDPRESLVSPGRSGGGAPPDPNSQGKVWKISEVNQFYKDVALGKYRGREKDSAAIDADITRANAEGRIIAG